MFLQCDISSKDVRRDDRVAEGGALEKHCPAKPDRGFESPSLRTQEGPILMGPSCVHRNSNVA